MYNKAINKIRSQIKELEVNGRIFDYLNLSIPIFMGVFLFFTPFPHTTSIKEICFYLSVFIVLLLILFKKTDFSFNTPLSLPFVIFVAWAFIGIFFALDKENSIHDFRAHLLEYLAIYYILINFFNSRKRLIVLSWVVIVSASAFSIGGMFNFYFILENPIQSRLGFAQFSVDYIGFVTVFAILLSLHHFSRVTNLYSKIALIVCLLGTSMATLLTQSRGTLLAMIFSFLILFLKNKKEVVVFCLLLLIAIGFMPVKGVLTPDAIIGKLKTDDRIKIWYSFYEKIKDHSIIGVGFGMETCQDKELLRKYNARVPVKYRPSHLYSAPHNSFVDIATRTGFVGLAFFFYILFMFVRMSWKIIRYGEDDFIRAWGLCLMAAFVAVMIQGFFADGMFGPQAIVLYTIFAMTTILWGLNEESSDNFQRKITKAHK